jgi:hypothetical protein
MVALQGFGIQYNNNDSENICRTQQNKIFALYNVACRSAAGQWLQDKQIYNSG